MPLNDWILDELAFAGSEHLDPDYVAGYDRKAATNPDEDLKVLFDLGLDTTHTIIDFGAGTGTFALVVAPYCRRVVAVDVSAAMLSELRAKAEHLKIRNIEFVKAGFLSYEHERDPADFVYSRHALHHLPDFWKAIALQRVASMLRVDGVLRLRDLVYSFKLNEAANVIHAWLDAATEQPEIGWTRAEYLTHLHEEYSTYSWLLEPMLVEAGFAITGIHHHRGIFSAYTCVRKR